MSEHHTERTSSTASSQPGLHGSQLSPTAWGTGTHTYTLAHLHAHAHTHRYSMHTCEYMHVCPFMHTYAHTQMHNMHACVSNMYTWAHVYAYTRSHVQHMHTYTHEYVHTHPHVQTHTRTLTHTPMCTKSFCVSGALRSSGHPSEEDVEKAPGVGGMEPEPGGGLAQAGVPAQWCPLSPSTPGERVAERVCRWPRSLQGQL